MDLSKAYDNFAAVPDAAIYPARWADAAQTFRDQMARSGRMKRGLKYGEMDRHALDLFLPQGEPSGLVVFIHGGYWRRFGREDFSHMAAGAVAHGWAVAVPSYRLAPAVRVSHITSEAARAVSHAAGLVDGPIRLVGHSAGGHLVARLGMLNGPLSAPLRSRLAAVVPISPVSDLRPLLQTDVNVDLKLDAVEAERESPALHRVMEGLPGSVWVGGMELPAFRDQARWLADAWNWPLNVHYERDHFNVIEDLSNPDSDMVRQVLSL